MHGEGDLFGQPFRLTADQRQFLDRLYRVDRDGRRIAKRALLGRAKGWGKTELLAAIGLAELCGPLAPPAANIPIAAASFEQADLLFGTAKVMVNEGPLKPYLEVFDTEILRRDGPGRMFRVAAAAGTNDGGRPTCFIADELHEWTGNRERVYLVIANSIAKRAGGLVLGISTAGIDRTSLLGRLYDYGLSVRAGTIDDPGFVFDWAEAHPSVDLATVEGRRQALLQANPHAEIFGQVDECERRFHEIPAHEWRRYFANQWVEMSPDSWLADQPGAWAGCLSELELPDGSDVAVGVDVSLRRDCTAVVVAGEVEGRTVVRSRVWNPQGDVVDHQAVMAHLRELCGRYTVRNVAYDPRFFEVPAQMLADEGLPMLEVPQSPERMIAACGRLYELIVSGVIAHNGDPTLASHVDAATRREGERGWTLSKPKSRSHIDAVIAMALAVGVLDTPLPKLPSIFSY